MNKTQAKNAVNLWIIIKEKIARKEPVDRLNTWISFCGTYGCVAGDYALRYDKKKLLSFGGSNLFVYEKYSSDFAFFNFFGFNRFSIGLDIIGDQYSGTLRQRLNHVAKQIKKAGYGWVLDQYQDGWHVVKIEKKQAIWEKL